MATITIKNIPDNVYLRIKERAKSNQRSLNSEIIFCIKEVMMRAPVRDIKRLLENSEKARMMTKGILTETEIERAINEGH